MAVVYSNSLKDSRMQAVINAIDANGPGMLEIATSGYAVILVAITLAHPSFTEANQQITLLGIPVSGTAAATGIAATARIQDGSGNVIVSGLTVGTSGADLILNSTSISATELVTITSGTISHG